MGLPAPGNLPVCFQKIPLPVREAEGGGGGIDTSGNDWCIKTLNSNWMLRRFIRYHWPARQYRSVNRMCILAPDLQSIGENESRPDSEDLLQCNWFVFEVELTLPKKPSCQWKFKIKMKSGTKIHVRFALRRCWADKIVVCKQASRQVRLVKRKINMEKAPEILEVHVLRYVKDWELTFCW